MKSVRKTHQYGLTAQSKLNTIFPASNQKTAQNFWSFENSKAVGETIEWQTARYIGRQSPTTITNTTAATVAERNNNSLELCTCAVCMFRWAR